MAEPWYVRLNREAALSAPRVPFIIRPGARVAVVGEAPGEEEERQLRPFVGAAGQELAHEAQDAGFPLTEASILNVFQTRPPGNAVETYFGLRRPELDPEWHAAIHAAGLPPTAIGQKGFLRPELIPQAAACLAALRALDPKPNLVLALGNTALWLLTGFTGITRLRGAITTCLYGPVGVKLLPTYHPAAVLRQWSWREWAVCDLRKAARELEFPEIIRRRRELWLEPTLEDLDLFAERHLDAATRIFYDIETVRRTQISSIALAPHPDVALVIPFIRLDGSSYWTSAEEELRAWEFVRQWLEHPHRPALRVGAHNGSYDFRYLRRVHISPRGQNIDTMLAHYALQPEMPKALADLGSIYCNESAWKTLRPRTLEDYKSED